MKRILIDLTDLIPKEMGGIEQYVRDLVVGFAQKSTAEYQFTLLVQPAHRQYFGKLPMHVRYKAIPGARRLKGRTRVWKVLLRAYGVNKMNYDLVHFPLQVVRFRISGLPIIVSIMDIQHESHPEFFSEPDLVARRYIYPHSIDQADRVIAISQFTAGELHHYYHTPLDKIDVVPLAINMNAPGKNAKRLPQIFYPAATWPHKNHLNLVKAFAMFAAHHPGYSLHFSGAKKQEFEGLMNTVHELGLEDKVIHHGYVTDAQVASLMVSSEAVVFPSLFEGFGIPVLEAMATKTPVACSDIAVLKELCGDAAIYFDPHSIKKIASAIEDVICNSKLRQKLLKQAPGVLSRYTVAALTENTIKSYDKVIG